MSLEISPMSLVLKLPFELPFQIPVQIPVQLFIDLEANLLDQNVNALEFEISRK